MSYLLRHHPQGLRMDKNGFVNLEDLVTRIRKRYPVDVAFITQLVSSSEKQRFQIVGNSIRALYGHTLSVKIDFPKNETIETLYHGTTSHAASTILETGLKPMQRQWIHLSPTRKIAWDVAARRTRNPVLLAINVKRARRAGVNFYQATDTIYLSKRIPAKYIKKLVKNNSHYKISLQNSE